jgi:hypothetical protein
MLRRLRITCDRLRLSPAPAFKDVDEVPAGSRHSRSGGFLTHCENKQGALPTGLTH